jgi:hypothetical protein
MWRFLEPLGIRSQARFFPRLLIILSKIKTRRRRNIMRNTLQAIAERCAAVCSPMRNDDGASEMRAFRNKRPLSLQGGKAAPCRISVYDGISTDSRKAAPCGDLPEAMVLAFSQGIKVSAILIHTSSHTMLPSFHTLYYSTLSSLHGKTLEILTTGTPLSKLGKRISFCTDLILFRSYIMDFDNGISVVKIRWYLRKKAPPEWTTPFLMYCYVGCKGE